MPRKVRIDAPGALHHIIVRGIERRKIFKDGTDRINFLDRLGVGPGLTTLTLIVYMITFEYDLIIQ